MANPQVFDELSSRMTKKRPDSGIHNSLEFSGSHDRINENSRSEPNDSGLGSDQVDSKKSKKSGMLKNIKKFFKKPKKKSIDPGQPSQSKSLDSQFEARSEPDIVERSTRSEARPPPMQRYYSEHHSQSVGDNDQSAIFSDDDETESKEKKKNIKDAQQYIRSSLRKLKIRRRKSEGSGSTTSDGKTPEPGDSRKEKEREKADAPHHAVNGFFATHREPEIMEIEPASPINESFNLDAFDDISPRQIQTSAAKDKIRVAPKDRRKPSRYRSPPPSSTHTSSLKEISEDTEKPSSLRNSSHYSNNSSKTSLHDHTVGSTHSVEEKQFFTGIHLPQPSEAQPNAYIEDINAKYSASDRSGSPPQRSKSTNSRENINTRKAHRTGSGESSELHQYRDVRSCNSLGEIDLSHINRTSVKPAQSEHDYLPRKHSKGSERESRFKQNEYPHKSSVERLNSAKSSDDDQNFFYGSRDNVNRSDYDRNENGSSSVGNLYRDVLRKSQEDLSMPVDMYKNETSRTASVSENLYSRDRLRKSQENISSVNTGRTNQETVSSSGKLYGRESLRKSHNDISEKAYPRRSTEIDTQRKLSSDTETKSESRNSFKETMFVLTSPRRDLELPPDFIEKRDRKEDKISDSNSVSENNHEIQNQVGNCERPQSVKISSADFAKPRKELIMPVSKSNDGVKDIGKSLKPSTKPKPSPRKDRKEAQTPEFNRISLKRVPKTDDFTGDGNENNSAKSPDTEDDRSQEFSQVLHKASFKSTDSPKSTERAREPVAPRKSVSPTETMVSPEFKRLSLKSVPKRDDYLTKEEVLLPGDTEKKTHTTPIQSNERKNEFNFLPPRSATVSGRNSPKPPPKPRVETKPFSFQSKDVISSNNRSMSLSSGDGRRRTTSPTTHEESKGPEWIRIAKSKQHENDEEIVSQSAVKPSVTKPKPKLETPSSNAPMKASKSTKLGSPPLPVPSRAAHSFKGEVAKSSKDLCIVCEKVAYMFERCDVDKHILHKNCAKCETCFRKLNVGGIFIIDNKPYCGQHKL